MVLCPLSICVPPLEPGDRVLVDEFEREGLMEQLTEEWLTEE